jgi:glycogen operon protein
MTDEAWNADFVRSVGMLLPGNAIEEVDERGEPIMGDTLLVLLNAHNDKVPFTLPALDPDQQWQRVFDTIDAQVVGRTFRPGSRYPLQGRSLAVFKVTPPLRERRRTSFAARAAAVEPAAASEPAPEPVSTES